MFRRARTCFTLLLSAGVLHAEPSSVRWDTSAEVSGYRDSDGVSTLTPAVTAGARDPLSGWSAIGSYLVDIVSAASVDIVATASPHWVELRHAGTLTGRYKPGTWGAGFSAAASVEPDYVSLSGGVTGSFDFHKKNATLELGYAYSHDTAGRTGTPFSVYSLTLTRHDLAGSLELVLDRATTLTPSFELVLESGHQEKPYRYLPLFEASVAYRVSAGASIDEVNQLRLPGRTAESLPDSRRRTALAGTLAHRFHSSTLKLFDRLYADSWGLRASTTDLTWTFELGRRFSLWPHARFHSQGGVSFWERAYVGQIASGTLRVPRYRSGDRELSPLWTATLGPGARWDLGGSDPRAFSAILEVDGSYTRYADALYVAHRYAGFAVAGVEATFQ